MGKAEGARGEVTRTSVGCSEESGKALFLLDNFKRDPLLLDNLGSFLVALDLDTVELFITFLDFFEACASAM